MTKASFQFELRRATVAFVVFQNLNILSSLKQRKMFGKLLMALAICSFAFICKAAPSDVVSMNDQIFKIVYEKDFVRDFKYIPTASGYKFSYKLRDGTYREENANIVDPNSREAQAFIKAAQDHRDHPLPRDKNRKLSPKALQSLAG